MAVDSNAVRLARGKTRARASALSILTLTLLAMGAGACTKSGVHSGGEGDVVFWKQKPGHEPAFTQCRPVDPGLLALANNRLKDEPTQYDPVEENEYKQEASAGAQDDKEERGAQVPNKATDEVAHSGDANWEQEAVDMVQAQSRSERQQLIELLKWEALRYRLCEAYANDVVEAAAYWEVLQRYYKSRSNEKSNGGTSIALPDKQAEPQGTAPGSERTEKQ